MSSLPQIRDEWRVPARPGQRVAVWIPPQAHAGTITGSTEHGMIVADFDDFPVPQVVHPLGISYVPEDFDPTPFQIQE